MQKEGVEVAPSGIEEERVAVAPAKPAAAARVAAEKEGDAPEVPSSIKEERTEVVIS